MLSLLCTLCARHIGSLRGVRQGLQIVLGARHTGPLTVKYEQTISVYDDEKEKSIPKKMAEPFFARPPITGPKAVSTVTLSGLFTNSSCRCGTPDMASFRRVREFRSYKLSSFNFDVMRGPRMDVETELRGMLWGSWVER